MLLVLLWLDNELEVSSWAFPLLPCGFVVVVVSVCLSPRQTWSHLTPALSSDARTTCLCLKSCAPTGSSQAGQGTGASWDAGVLHKAQQLT